MYSYSRAMPVTLKPTDCLRFGWNTFKSRPGFFIGAFVLVGGIDIVVRIVTAHGDDASAMLQILDFVVSVLCGTLIGMGVISFSLKAHDNPAGVTLHDLWPQVKLIWKYLAVEILTIVTIVIGLILIIVPGVIAMVLLSFSYYPVIDRGAGPVEAMKESVRITKGNRLAIFWLFLLLLLVNLVGLLLLVVGLVVTVPVSTLAMIHAYRTLSRPAVVPAAASMPFTTQLPA
jgi:uncharacterized membrane protein